MYRAKLPASALSRRLLAVTAVIAVIAGTGGIALAATASASSKVINGCYNARTGALRVLTPRSKSCGAERKISWNQTGPAGNGYSFVTTAGGINKLGTGEADGPVVTKAGTYFVNVNAGLNISAYSSASSGLCALDLQKASPSTFVYGIFSAWDYPYAGDGIDNYPESTSGMIQVSASDVGYQLTLACFDNSGVQVPISSDSWLVSPVGARAGTNVSIRSSKAGPAGFKLLPAVS
ncbi:MAG TPA: hypothetical protein VGI58_18140, partial [Streptosporangiaceae bacterium]